MTYRDANAHPMTDYFDFRRPAFLEPPKLAAAPNLGRVWRSVMPPGSARRSSANAPR